MSLIAHLLDAPEPDALAALRAALDPAVHLTLGPAVPPDCAILVGGRPSREQVAGAPDLRAVVSPWAGLPEPTRTLMLDFSQVAVHNLHHNHVPVAEMAVALLLAAARRLVPADRALRAGDWSPRYAPEPAPILSGKTALILGYGAIGRHVAHICRAFGMQVRATRRSAAGPAADAGVQLYPASDLRRLLPEADALLVCVPHTPDTTGLIG